MFGAREVLRLEKECVDFTPKLPAALRAPSSVFQPDSMSSESLVGGEQRGLGW